MHLRGPLVSTVAPLLGALLLLTSSAGAQTGTLDATGTVSFSSITTGPFAGLAAGTPASLHLKIALPGQPLAPGQYELYTIDAAASYLRVGAVQMALKAGGEPLGLTNDYPVADGVHLFTTPLVQAGHGMEFELFDGTGGQIFESTDFADATAYYGPELFTYIAWTLFGGGGEMSLALDQLAMHPVSTAGTWLLAGPGLAGSGPAPLLHGGGALTPGQTVTLSLHEAPPTAATALVVGLGSLQAPFKGGVLIPRPDLVFTGLLTSAAGELVLPAAWPAGVPGGFSLWYQTWTADGAGPQGFTASNGLRSTTP